MSLFCGNCRTEVFGDFGLLYRLERTSEGKLCYPDRTKDYVPANSSICASCWAKLPDAQKHAGKNAKKNAERRKGDVYAYAPADSTMSAVWGSKTWSGIVSQVDKLQFVRAPVVMQYFPKAIEIIDGMARDRAPRSCRAENGEKP